MFLDIRRFIIIFSDFTYNNITFARLVRTSGYRAEFVNGDQVGIRDTITALPGVDGVERYKSFYRDRLIEIRGFVIGYSENDLYNKINALEAAFDIHNLENLFEDGFAPLQFSDPGQNTAFYYCKPIKNTLTVTEKRTGFARGFAILLEAKDPRKYLITESVYTVQPSTAVASSYFPFTFPVVFSGDTFTGTQTINNGGSTSAYPTQVKVYGPCSGPKISNDTLSEDIELTSDVVLGATDYIIIDPRLGTVFKYDAQGNGVNIIRYLTAGSKFWAIEPGNNVITYTAQSMTAGSKTEVTIRLTV